MLRVQEILPKAQAEVGRYCVVFSRFGCLPAAGILMHGGLEQSHNIHSKQTGCLAAWLPGWLAGWLALGIVDISLVFLAYFHTRQQNV